MPNIYAEFKTSTEGGFDVPWPFVIFEETEDWRKRNNLPVPINKNSVKSAFLSFNEEVCDKFMEEHINAVIVAVVIDADSIDDLEKKIRSVFGYCEILGATPADGDPRVEKIMQGAQR